MIIAKIDSNNMVLNTIIVDSLLEAPADGTWVECPEWIGKGMDITTPMPPPVVAVPASVSRAQARKALVLAGLFASVQPAINAITDPIQRQLVQIDWDDSQFFERNNPTLAMLATALGLTSKQLDDLFIAAAAL